MRLDIIDDAIVYMTDLLQGNADGHDAGHILRVYHNAMEIAAEYPDCDKELIGLSALLHDADDHKLFHTENNENARRFLSSHGIEKQTADRICKIINSVSFSENKDRRPDTLEGEIVQDADRLDAIGAVGIARTFLYSGGHSLGMDDSIRHFHEKLLLLKDLMNTEKAKELAQERHEFMLTFLKQLHMETGR